jgi:hypothetical protein
MKIQKLVTSGQKERSQGTRSVLEVVRNEVQLNVHIGLECGGVVVVVG